MIVEYSTRFPFVSEIAVEGGEGRGGGDGGNRWKNLVTATWWHALRFERSPEFHGRKRTKQFLSHWPRQSGGGGGRTSSMFTRRCGARTREQNNRRDVATCPNPC